MEAMKRVKDGVSVIIPTFNRLGYLYATLVCLLHQNTENLCDYEIVIIDSGNDGTEKIIEYIKQTTKINVIYRKIKNCTNRSLLRNTGGKLANYEILVFLDNDMLTPPDFIQRHYTSHKEKEQLVVMGCRKSLISFDLPQITEAVLRDNFNIVETLPYYTDERLNRDIGVESWRFVFSHTLSLSKKDFAEAGQFNIEFGEHWGFEDLELGFRLMNNGCCFELMKDIFTYHQPHFTQSTKEQHEKSENGSLFIKLHNCFECELYESFYTSFDEYYPLLKEIRKQFIFPSSEQSNEYDFIFGCWLILMPSTILML